MMVAEIENALRSQNISEVPSREVGAMVMARLREIDEIAYIRFASVYRSFKDAQEMRATIEDVLAHPPGTRPDTARRQRKRRDTEGRELPLDLGQIECRSSRRCRWRTGSKRCVLGSTRRPSARP